jgi:putative oxidoreductase
MVYLQPDGPNLTGRSANGYKAIRCNQSVSTAYNEAKRRSLFQGKNPPKEDFVNQLLRTYRRAVSSLSQLQSPMLLAVRLYWGFQFAQTGWGKLHNLAKITAFFASLNIPFPAFNAPFVSTLEFVGGILLMLGLFSRPIALLLAGNMLVAYLTADREALASIFSDPGKFYVADPYTFLFASVMVLIFGAGFFAVDTYIAKRLKVAE